MSQYFQIHPDNPQERLIKQAVEIIQKGGVIVYPTDSTYALGCGIGEKDAIKRIRQIRQLSDEHRLTLVCHDLSDLATYAKVDNIAFRLLKGNTPGPYTFIFKATNEVPRKLVHPKRQTVGLRVPKNQIALDLLTELGGPLISTTFILPNQDEPMTSAEEIKEIIGNQVDLVIDGGPCSLEETSVIDFTNDTPDIIRQGIGDTQPFIPL